MNDRVLLDVNAFAIYLVEDHPGHRFIEREVEPGLEGKRQLLIYDYLPLLPLRAHWILRSRWKLPETETRIAITSFLEQPVTMVRATRETIRDAYEIAEQKRHDVFDCFYIALARQEAATRVLTTDLDFQDLCRGEDFEYLNPVPGRILSTFRHGPDSRRSQKE